VMEKFILLTEFAIFILQIKVILWFKNVTCYFWNIHWWDNQNGVQTKELIMRGLSFEVFMVVKLKLGLLGCDTT
jgi:hypothetical protein